MKYLSVLCIFWISLAGYGSAQQKGPAHASTKPVTKATLNGLEITIDNQSGSILGLSYPGVGQLLAADPERAGIVDVAYPIEEFEALRLASRFSTGVRISQSDSVVRIFWDNLGPSRTYFKPKGKVSATVWIRAMPDGTVSMRCEIENHGDLPVGQVLFPDLHGFLPVGGAEGTFLRTCGFVRRPFLDVGMTLYPEFYPLDDQTRPIDTRDTYFYTGGTGIGNGDNMLGRWLDYGGLRGGISIFPKLWAAAPPSRVRIFRLEKDPNVRLMYVDNGAIKPGGTWKSPRYILTPHLYGWAKGIETYRNFVKSRIARPFPVPQRIRQGLGFRTIYMSRWYPADGARDRSFTFSDLPKLARECKENGLDEIVVWHWFRHFILPIQDPYSNLGTPEDLSAAVKQSNRLGVDISLALSITSVSEPTASRYGLKVGKHGWTYHPEMIPRFNPPYTNGRATVRANTKDPRWINDVMTSVRKVYQNYTHSITWDEGSGQTAKVWSEFLPLVKKTDPRASFSGEVTHNIELLANYYDFTWNWELGSYYHNLMHEYRDVRGFNAAFPAPRLNYNINRNAQDIKFAFMDNSYVNIMPSQPDGANGTAWIRDYPQLGGVLKQCAGLRNQFLTYFTDGQLIGECLLRDPVQGAHVSAYVLADRLLLLVMNTSDQDRRIRFNIDLRPWLKSTTGKYTVKKYDQFGKRFGAEGTIEPLSRFETGPLRHYDMSIYEFSPR